MGGVRCSVRHPLPWSVMLKELGEVSEEPLHRLGLRLL